MIKTLLVLLSVVIAAPCFAEDAAVKVYNHKNKEKWVDFGNAKKHEMEELLGDDGMPGEEEGWYPGCYCGDRSTVRDIIQEMAKKEKKRKKKGKHKFSYEITHDGATLEVTVKGDHGSEHRYSVEACPRSECEKR